MPIFETADQLYTCFGGLLERMESHPNTQNVLKTLELTVKFTFSDPSGFMWLVVHCGEQSIYYGEYDEMSDIELAMTGDVAHRFWMGEINVMEAITKRQIVPIGPLSKMIILAPLIKTAIKIYPQHFQEYLRKGSQSVSS